VQSFLRVGNWSSGLFPTQHCEKGVPGRIGRRGRVSSPEVRYSEGADRLQAIKRYRDVNHGSRMMSGSERLIWSSKKSSCPQLRKGGAAEPGLGLRTAVANRITRSRQGQGRKCDSEPAGPKISGVNDRSVVAPTVSNNAHEDLRATDVEVNRSFLEETSLIRGRKGSRISEKRRRARDRKS